MLTIYQVIFFEGNNKAEAKFFKIFILFVEDYFDLQSKYNKYICNIRGVETVDYNKSLEYRLIL